MKTLRTLLFFAILASILALFACTVKPTTSPTEEVKYKKTYQDLVVGFAQLGAESEWRVANTVSIKETAE